MQLGPSSKEIHISLVHSVVQRVYYFRTSGRPTLTTCNPILPKEQGNVSLPESLCFGFQRESDDHFSKWLSPLKLSSPRNYLPQKLYPEVHSRAGDEIQPDSCHGVQTSYFPHTATRGLPFCSLGKKVGR